MAMVWRVPRAITPGLVLVQPTYLDSAQQLVPCAWEPPVGVAPATPSKPMSPSIMAPLMTPDAPRRGQRERRPPRHLPRGSKFPGGGQATPARKLVFVEDNVDEAAGLALLALARCA